ncbi:MAG: hypothetical protein WCP21_00930 [Armatimonadota bacterium]
MTTGDVDTAVLGSPPFKVGKTLDCKLKYTLSKPSAGRKMSVFVDDDPTPRMILEFKPGQSTGELLGTLVLSDGPERDVKIRVEAFAASVETGRPTCEVSFGEPLLWTDAFLTGDHASAATVEASYLFHCKP